MPLIANSQLLTRLIELLNASTHVDIAVAWVGPGLAVDALIEQAEYTEIRLAVELSGNATEPATLRRLMAQENVQLRVVPAPRGGIFHSKFYRFRSQESTVCWIGSVNFTRRGFGGNVELVNEFSDTKNAGGTWFAALWQELDDDPGPAIDHYEMHYRPPRPRMYEGGQIPPGELPSLEDIDTWANFVDALHTLDDYCHHQGFSWDVLGDTFSYLHTIGAGRDVVLRGNWQQHFTHHHRNVLLGLSHWDGGGAWGLLGNMGMAHTAVHAFTPPVDQAVLNHVRDELDDVIEDDGENLAAFINTAQNAVEGLMELDGLGPGVTTRLLTLACPDRLVSVNRAAAEGLATFAGMPPNAPYLAAHYDELLEVLYGKQWFGEPEPESAFHKEIWRCRAALVDAFVYIPTL